MSSMLAGRVRSPAATRVQERESGIPEYGYSVPAQRTNEAHRPDRFPVADSRHGRRLKYRSSVGERRTAVRPYTSRNSPSTVPSSGASLSPASPRRRRRLAPACRRRPPAPIFCIDSDELVSGRCVCWSTSLPCEGGAHRRDLALDLGLEVGRDLVGVVAQRLLGL